MTCVTYPGLVQFQKVFTLYMGTVYTLCSEAMLAVTTGKAPEHGPSALRMHCSVQPHEVML